MAFESPDCDERPINAFDVLEECAIALAKKCNDRDLIKRMHSEFQPVAKIFRERIKEKALTDKEKEDHTNNVNQFETYLAIYQHNTSKLDPVDVAHLEVKVEEAFKAVE